MLTSIITRIDIILLLAVVGISLNIVTLIVVSLRGCKGVK